MLITNSKSYCLNCILAITLLLNSNIVMGQNEGFLDSTFVWTEAYTGPFLPISVSYKFTIDSKPTVFFGKTFYEVLITNSELSQNWMETGDYIRFENNIVYYTTGQNEDEIYNFDLAVNDTFLTMNDLNLVVESIDTVTLLNGEQKKQWKLRCADDEGGLGFGFAEWIEGIGNVRGLFATDGMCLFDIGGSDILCMYRNGELIYDNPEIDTCWLMTTSIREEEKDKIDLAPNPATDFISILGANENIRSVQVFDILGNQIYQGKEPFIELKSIPGGFYFAFIKMNDNRTLAKGFLKL